MKDLSTPIQKQTPQQQNSVSFKTHSTSHSLKYGTSVGLITTQKRYVAPQSCISTRRLDPYRKTESIQNENVIPVQEQVRRIYLLNTEQMSVAMFLHNTKMDIQKYKPNVIDYSLENISILQEHFPSMNFLHFPYPFKVVENCVKTNAVVSLFSSGHRKEICNNLGIELANFTNMWGNTRDVLIRKSKILLNIHYQPFNYKIFESIRCYNALAQRTLVITEPCYDKNLILLKDFIIFTPSEEMREKVREVLDNYELYYNQVFSESQIQEIDKRLRTVYEQSLKPFISSP
jgi:hypothetical protein